MATTVVNMKTVSCGDHHGMFKIPVRRGRNPRACTPENPCDGVERAAKRVTRDQAQRGSVKTVATPKGPRTTLVKPSNATKTASVVKNRRTGTEVNAMMAENTKTASGYTVLGEDNMKEIAERIASRRTTELPEKQLPEFQAYFPARMKGDEWVILHAAGCDHLNARQLKRTENVTLDLFATDMGENLSKLDVDGLGYDWNNVGISNCALNHAKRARRTTQKANRAPSAVVVKTNPALPLAQAAKEKLEPLGWTVQGRAWVENESENTQSARITATRGTELLVITWTVFASGEINVDQTYDLWNTEKPAENAKPKASLPFNPALVDDDELVQTIAGQRITWFNSIGKSRETGVVNAAKLKIEKHYNESGHTVPSERIITFVDHEGTGYRSFRLSALLKIG